MGDSTTRPHRRLIIAGAACVVAALAFAWYWQATSLDRYLKDGAKRDFNYCLAGAASARSDVEADRCRLRYEAELDRIDAR